MDKKHPEIPVGEPTDLSSFIATHLLAYYDIGWLDGEERFFDHEDHEDLSSFIAGLLAHRESEIAAIFEKAEDGYKNPGTAFDHQPVPPATPTDIRQ